MPASSPSEELIHRHLSIAVVFAPAELYMRSASTPRSWASVPPAPALTKSATFLVVDAGEQPSSSQRISSALEGLQAPPLGFGQQLLVRVRGRRSSRVGAAVIPTDVRATASAAPAAPSPHELAHSASGPCLLGSSQKSGLWEARLLPGSCWRAFQCGTSKTVLGIGPAVS